MRYFLAIKYKGTVYHGWQVQKNALSVQEVLNNALQTVLQQEVVTYGSGRTDTGVHAAQQFVQVDVAQPLHVEKVIISLNRLLPGAISVTGIYRVRDDASARHDAVSRTYEYRIIHEKDPFLSDMAWQVHRHPDVAAMNQAAAVLLQHEDFECFSRVKTDVGHFRCTIEKAGWTYRGAVLVFEITANRFLRGMVRTIVGTLLDVGWGKQTVGDVEKIIQSRDRRQAGRAVPARGLTLTRVEYPESVFVEGVPE